MGTQHINNFKNKKKFLHYPVSVPQMWFSKIYDKFLSKTWGSLHAQCITLASLDLDGCVRWQFLQIIFLFGWNVGTLILL